MGRLTALVALVVGTERRPPVPSFRMAAIRPSCETEMPRDTGVVSPAASRASAVAATWASMVGRFTTAAHTMSLRCFEEEKLRGAIVWLGEHQHLWPAWRAIAEAEGGNALSGHLAAMMMDDGLKRFGSSDYMCEMCIGASAKRGAGRTDIELSMALATRSLPIITHAFKNARSRDAVMSFLMSEDRTIGSVELAELALLKGRSALARKLDNIASNQLRTPGWIVQ